MIYPQQYSLLSSTMSAGETTIGYRTESVETTTTTSQIPSEIPEEIKKRIIALLRGEGELDAETINAFAHLWSAFYQPIQLPTKAKTTFSLTLAEVGILVTWGIGTLLLLAFANLSKYTSTDAVQLVLYWSSVLAVLLGAKGLVSFGSGKASA